jgi:hypothetical protein
MAKVKKWFQLIVSCSVLISPHKGKLTMVRLPGELYNRKIKFYQNTYAAGQLRQAETAGVVGKETKQIRPFILPLPLHIVQGEGLIAKGTHRYTGDN